MTNDEALTPEKLRRQALEEAAYRKVNEKYRYYVPNGKVAEMIQIVGENEHFVSLFSAANGVGKTACGVNVLANMMFPVGNPYFNYPLFNKFPYLKRGRIVSDATTITEQIVPELEHWLPAGRYQTSKHSKPYAYNWQTDSGFNFNLMTYDQEIKEFESVTLGWAWFDEPPPETIYKATVSRMRRGGIIFITATPLMGSAWMFDKIYTQATLIK